jgi:hypothetical protein
MSDRFQCDLAIALRIYYAVNAAIARRMERDGFPHARRLSFLTIRSLCETILRQKKRINNARVSARPSHTRRGHCADRRARIDVKERSAQITIRTSWQRAVRKPATARDLFHVYSCFIAEFCCWAPLLFDISVPSYALVAGLLNCPTKRHKCLSVKELHNQRANHSTLAQNCWLNGE